MNSRPAHGISTCVCTRQALGATFGCRVGLPNGLEPSQSEGIEAGLIVCKIYKDMARVIVQSRATSRILSRAGKRGLEKGVSCVTCVLSLLPIHYIWIRKRVMTEALQKRREKR